MKNLQLPTPALIFLGWLLTMTLIPFSIIIGMSFLQKSSVGSISAHFSLDNYFRCFQFVYVRVFARTLVLATSATAICLIIGFPIAYYLARSGERIRQIGLILLFIPFWTNFILRIYGIISILGNNGLFNQLLMRLGIINEPIHILYTRLGVYIGLVYNYLPFLVIPIFSSLEKLAPELREAATDLGANRVQTFLKVTLPNVREGVFIGSLFVFIPMLGEYVIPDLLGGAKETFLGHVMVSQFFTMQDWPFGSAFAGLLSALMVLALYMKYRWQKRFPNQLASSEVNPHAKT